jgi:formylglycine-generating enzyme required for sulfatase activity
MLGRFDTVCSTGGADVPAGLSGEFGRYQILRKLGEGGMGTVYLARDTLLGRQVALKVPRYTPEEAPEFLERFQREARAAATFDHPNLCPVHDVGQVEGVHYLTMPFIEGKTLEKVLDSMKPMPQHQAASVARKLALAVQQAHDRGVIHRDLKPSNVMVNRARGLVVMDFGLTRRFDAGDESLTKSGVPLGTAFYMAPEQAAGDPSAVGPGCDIYSLGVILYEMLAGRRPFEGPSLQVLRMVAVETPEPPSAFRPGLDPALEAVCLKALAKRPADRFASMADFAAALGEYLSETRPRRERTPARAPGPLTPGGAGAAARVTSSVGIALVRIEPGSFLMGSPDSDRGASDYEKPQHRVSIRKAYALAETAVTQGQYRTVMGNNPSRFQGSDDLPVERVSWFDAVRFCNELSAREGLTPFYKVIGKTVEVPDWTGEGYRLPTEAEWEYACRAGGTTKYSFGDDPSGLGEYAWFRDNSGGKTHPVRERKPNALGLYDMHGNVWEWCWDGYDAEYYAQSPADDPAGPLRSEARVIRGGSWYDDPLNVRSAYRFRLAPENRDDYLGFRVARSHPEL